MKHLPFMSLLLIMLTLSLPFIFSCGDDDDDDNDDETSDDDTVDDDDDTVDDDDTMDDDDDDDNDDDDPVLLGWLVGDPGDENATILRSDDGGESWEQKGQQVPTVVIYDVCSIDENTAWVVGGVDSGYGTIYLTENNGDSWQRQGSEEDLSELFLYGVDAVSATTAWAVGGSGLIVKTTDQGDSWNVQGLAKGATDAELMKVDGVDEMTAWAVGDGGSTDYAVILITTDGETWTRVGTGEELPTALIDVGAISDQIAWVVGTEGQAHLTQNGGESWEAFQIISSDYHVNGVCALSEDSAWVATDQGGIYYTTDTGQNWTNASPTPEQVPGIPGFEMMGITTKDGQSVWSAGIIFGWPPDGRLVYSSDSGTNWQQQASDFEGINFNRVSFLGACN